MGQYRLGPDVATRIRAATPGCSATRWAGAASPSRPAPWSSSSPATASSSGAGYVDQEHAIAVRVLTRNPDERVAPGRRHDRRPLRARGCSCAGCCSAAPLPQAMRLFAGESEGLPGVTVDRYGDFVVVQWLSAGALAWRDELYDAIEATLEAARDLRAAAVPAAGRRQAPPEPAVRARGEEAPLELVVEDGGCRFGVDVTAPLGVGLFPDMRLGWAAVAARAAERRVLNLFSYTGAFSVYAAKAGAREVVAVDIAAKAHARARRNFELSGSTRRKLEAIDRRRGQGAGAGSRRAGAGSIIVVCDPPTFSHGPAGQFSVARDLARLAAAALPCSSRAASCRSRPTRPRCPSRSWIARSARAAATARADLRIVERVGLPPDFPVAPGFPEGNYLKVAIAVRAWRDRNRWRTLIAAVARARRSAAFSARSAAGLHLVEVLPDRVLDRLVELDLASWRSRAATVTAGLLSQRDQRLGRRWRAGARARRRESPARSGCEHSPDNLRR